MRLEQRWPLRTSPSLNPEQLAAVAHEGSSLLILAGAGSGKTRVITTKIAYLVRERGVQPESILAVTFTNKAAREMRDRATAIEASCSRAMMRTFHSFGAWFLRRNAAAAGLDANFTIYDDDDQATLLHGAMPQNTRVECSRMVQAISRAKDLGLEPDSPDLSAAFSDPGMRRVYALYEDRLRKTGNVDFGDLIGLPARLLREDEAVRQAHAAALPRHPRRRVPGLQRRPVRAPAPARGARRGRRSPRRPTSAWSATTTSRSTASAARRCGTSSASPKSSPAPRSSSSSATTAPSRASSTSRATWCRTTRAGSARHSSPSAAAASRPSLCAPRRPGRGSRPLRQALQGARAERGQMERRRHPLPDERAVPRLREGIPAPGHPLPDRRLLPLLRPRGGQGRPGLPGPRSAIRATRSRSSASSTSPTRGIGETSVDILLDAAEASGTTSSPPRRGGGVPEGQGPLGPQGLPGPAAACAADLAGPPRERQPARPWRASSSAWCRIRASSSTTGARTRSRAHRRSPTSRSS